MYIYLEVILKNYSEDNLLNALLRGAETLTSRMNKEILKCTISFFKKSNRFISPLYFVHDQIYIVFYVG